MKLSIDQLRMIFRNNIEFTLVRKKVTGRVISYTPEEDKKSIKQLNVYVNAKNPLVKVTMKDVIEYKIIDSPIE